MADSDVGEIAKALGKTADFGKQALQTGEKAGGFFSRVFQDPIEQRVGMYTDELKFKRWKRTLELKDQAYEELAKRGVTVERDVPLKLGIPLLEKASLEEDPSLQKLWTHLLANAMDPAFTAELRVAYTDMIQSLSPLDARILSLMYSSLRDADRPLTHRSLRRSPFSSDRICSVLSLSPTEYETAIGNLMRLNCVEMFVEPISLGTGLTAQGSVRHLASHADSTAIVLTPFGLQFLEACTDNTADLDAVAIPIGFTSYSTIDTKDRIKVVGLH